MKNLYRSVLPALLLFSASFTFAQTPEYNSHPAASAVIFLDFDGHTVSGTSWNGGNTFYCGPSNLNNNQVTEIFNRVAEDYRPFTINVTTDSTKYWSAPATKRVRVILTITSAWYGSAGGVAHIGSFTWGDNTPCFVFTALHNYNIKNITEATSHEAGHTLGLRHQSSYDVNCTKTSDYNYGTGVGEISWAPIMGVGYSKNFTIWHNGPNSFGCTNYQSDLDIIAGPANGFGFRTDDHSETFSGATPASFINNQFEARGIISKTNDEDLFKFEVSRQSYFELDGIPYNVGSGNTGSDLDMQVELIDGAENVVGIYNPGNALSSIIDTLLMAGIYYLRVDGKGNQYTSEYGSLGAFSLQARTTDINPLPVRKLQLKGTPEGSKHKLSWTIEADEAVVRQVVEASANGGSFSLITETSGAVRTYTYTPNGDKALQYRIGVTFDNGRQSYSNIVAIRGAKTVKPQLFTNVIHTNVLLISNPGNYDYIVNDATGRTVAKGRLSAGSSTIYIAHLTTGIYTIRFTNAQEQYLEKFMKQ